MKFFHTVGNCKCGQYHESVRYVFGEEGNRKMKIRDHYDSCYFCNPELIKKEIEK